MQASVQVIVVDDHTLVREGIIRMLDDVEHIEVIGGAESGEAALKLIKLREPNIVLMDLNMPGMGGLEATKKITRQYPGVKIIVITVCDTEPFPSTLLSAGAAGYVTKGAPVEEVLRAIKTVHAGQRYISPSIAQQLALKTFGPIVANPFSQLSERELQIVLMIIEGKKVSDIATRLFLSPKTVNTYRYRVFEKLGLQNDVELVLLAVRHQIINPHALNQSPSSL